VRLAISPRFIRSGLTSLLTTAFDFATLTGVVELLHVNYVLATWLGTVVGSLSNFTINKHWAFKGSSVPLPHQLGRFVLVQAGSSAWNTLGVWLMTRYGGLDYKLSKLFVAALVALAWNYPMNRFFVFGRKHPTEGESADSSGP
jgi:putative flippase GtrA